MRILVVASSKHGATNEIADFIAEQLDNAGYDVARSRPEDVSSLDDVDAVVCGSAVYMTQWMEESRAFLDRFRSQLAELPFWAFSVGMSGIPKHSPQDPFRIGPALLKVQADDHHSFAGRYDPGLLSLRERSIARLAGAVEGDFRDWDEVADWTRTIIAHLEGDLP
ncbi:MAG: flavodoxin [Actinobacteria bacterium]|nr:MAG: flavodoxin [Actinomycetota bacterium]